MASYPFVILVVYDMLTGLYVSYPGLMRFAGGQTAEKSRSEARVSRWVPLWDDFLLLFNLVTIWLISFCFDVWLIIYWSNRAG